MVGRGQATPKTARFDQAGIFPTDSLAGIKDYADAPVEEGKVRNEKDRKALGRARELLRCPSTPLRANGANKRAGVNLPAPSSGMAVVPFVGA